MNPRLSLPADLTSVDPAWADCQPLFYGAFDPPRFLTKENGRLSSPSRSEAPVTSAESAVVPALSAVVQATPAPGIPAPTSVANAGTEIPSSLLGGLASNPAPVKPVGASATPMFSTQQGP